MPSELQAGDHPTPNAAKAAPAQVPKPSTDKQIASDLDTPYLRTTRAIASAKRSTDAADKSDRAAGQLFQQIASSRARLKASDYYPVLNLQMAARAEAVYQEALRQRGEASQARQNAKSALDRINVELRNIEDEADRSQKAKDAATRAESGVPEVGYFADVVKKQVEALAKNVKGFPTTKLNPPIDALSQSTQFILTYGSSISPNWMLLRWNGPSGPLGSASGITTHILNIAIGPRPTGGSATNPEVQRILQNLTVQQLKN